MARIAGVDLPKNKRIEIGLTYIYGIGRSTADEILAGTGVNPDVRVKDLSEEDVQNRYAVYGFDIERYSVCVHDREAVAKEIDKASSIGMQAEP